MPASLPYLSTPGTIDTAFKRIRDAATPSRVTNDFVNAVLQIKGGTGATIPPFLKKLGFLNPDGTPTALYDRLRNDTTTKPAIAEAVRSGYRPLYQANEYAHKLSDQDLKGLILQVTGLEKDNRIAQLIYQTFKKLVAHAAFDAAALPDQAPAGTVPEPLQTLSVTPHARTSGRGLGLTYTISLNLPPTTNIEVFNAIFRSLREHLVHD